MTKLTFPCFSLDTALSGVITGEIDFDNATLRQRESFSLQFGLTSWLAEGLYIEPSVSFGLNGPGNSFVLGVSLPYTYFNRGPEDGLRGLSLQPGGGSP